MDRNAYFHSQRDWVSGLLCDMIAIPSMRGKEPDVHQLLAEHLNGFVDDCRLTAFPADIVNDPEYSLPDPGLDYRGKNNLRMSVGKGRRAVILNSHSDVVPPSRGQEDAFSPRLQDNVIFGRGACDAKGQLAVIALVLKAMAELGRPDVRVIVHIASEEESGGNGTLALVRQETEKADMAVILEPSELQILPSVRGAIWFEAQIHGSSAHAGNAQKTDSAIFGGIDFIHMMERYHRKLRAESENYGLFAGLPNAAPLTFGTFHAGNWASTVPDAAAITGVMGLLPNKTAAGVIDEIGREIAKPENAALREKLRVTYPYRHDAVETDPDSALVRGLAMGCKKAGIRTEVSAMRASCDAVFYQKLMGISAAVFGPGALSFAHTTNEQICVEDILSAAWALYEFLSNL